MTDVPRRALLVQQLALLGDLLVVHLDDVIGEWIILGREEPWLALPPEAHLDGIPEALIAMLQWTLKHPTSDVHRQRAAELAAKHGRSRATFGFADHLIFKEYYALRESLWRSLRRREAEPDVAYAAIGEARDEWPRRLLELCAETPPPVPAP